MANYLPSQDYLRKLQQKHSTAINSSSGSKEKPRDLKANAERMQALKSMESELADRLKETYHYGNTSQGEYSAMRDRLEQVRSEMNAISPGSVQASASERFGRNLGGTAQQYLSDMADSIAFIGRAVNAAHDSSSEEQKAINDSIYSGYVTDDLTAANFERDAKEGLIRSDGVISDVKNINTGINAFADRMASEAQKEIEASRQGATGAQRLLLDLESGATGLLLDALAGAVVPGGAKVAMALRSFGSGAREAQEAGGNLLQQAATGALRATLSTQIERLSGGAFDKIYGKGALDDVINLTINKIAKTDAGRTALRFLMDAVGEGGEEWLEAILDPAVTLVYDKGAGFTQRFSSWDAWKEAASNDLYEGLIGTLLGVFGAGSNAVNGKYYMLNAQQPSPRPGNILLDIYNERVARQQANAQAQNAKNNERAGVQAEASQEAAGRAETQGDESIPPAQQAAPQMPSDELNSGFYQPGELAQYGRTEDAYGNLVRDNAFAPERVRTADDYERSAIGMQNAPRSKPWSASNTDILADVALGNQALNQAEDEAVDAMFFIGEQTFFANLDAVELRLYNLLSGDISESTVRQILGDPELKKLYKKIQGRLPTPDIFGVRELQDSLRSVEHFLQRKVSSDIRARNQDPELPNYNKPVSKTANRKQTDAERIAAEKADAARRRNRSLEKRFSYEEYSKQKADAEEAETAENEAYWDELQKDAEYEYAQATREFWEDNPDAVEIPNSHPLGRKTLWIRDMVNQLHKEKQQQWSNRRETETNRYYGGNEFSERVFEEVLNSKDMTPREKLNTIDSLAEEYGIEDHGWYINSDGEVVNENYSSNRYSGETNNEDIETRFSSVGLSNTKVGSENNKGQFVPEFRSTRSSREDAPSNVGTTVTNEMRDAREAEIAKAKELEAEAQKTKLKPTTTTFKDLYKQGKIPAIPASNSLKNQSSSDNMVANSNGGNINGRENNARPESAAERGNAQSGGKGERRSSDPRETGGNAENSGRNGRRGLADGQSDGRSEGKGGREAYFLSEEVALQSNRKGRLLSNRKNGNISFGENTYEVTKPNRRDTAVKNWIKKVSGYDVVLVHGEMKLNGVQANGVRNAKNKTIYVDVSTGKDIQTAVHEVLHAKLDEARGNGAKYSKSNEAFSVLAASVENNAEKSKALETVYRAVESAYYSAYYSQRVEVLKSKGYSDSEIESLHDEIDKHVRSRCQEEVIIAIATKQTGNSVVSEIAMLSSAARKILIGLDVVDADFFNSIPYAKEADKIKPALTKTKAPKTLQDVVVDFALENANKSAPQSAEPDVAEKLTGIPPLPKSRQATSQSPEDNTLPFSFGGELAVEPVSEPAKPAAEQAAVTEPAEKTPKKLFGSRSDSVAKTAERIDGLKMFTENKAFKEFHGAKAAYVVYQELGKYKRAIREFGKGEKSIHELRDDFKGMLTNERLKMFSSDYIVQQLDQAVAAYDFLNSSDDVTQYDVNKYNWAVDNVLKAIATRAETVNRIVNNQITVANAIKSKKLPANIVGKAANSVFSLQLNAPTIFKMIDGFEKAKGGIGYAFSNVAEECAGVYAIERSNGNKFFEKFMTNEHAAFANDTERTGVKLGEHDLTQQEAVSVIRLFSTMDTPNRRKFAGLKGFMYEADGKEVWHNFGKNPYEEFKQLHDDLLKALSPSAKSYIRSLNGMFGYYWPKLSSVQKRVSGNGGAPKAEMSYFPLRYTQKGKALEDYSLAKSMENDSLDDAFEHISGPRPSILQSRSEQSGGYLVLEPASVVANRYINQASQYIANADFSNTLELMNTTTALAPGLSETLEAAWGKSYGNWMNKYISDMSFKKQAKEQSEAMELLSSVIRTGRRNLQQGALLLNPSTPLKQGAAAFVAFGEIKPTSVLKALATKRGASKGNALAADRRSGGIDPALADLLTQTDTWVGKLKSKSAVFKWMADSIGRSDSKVVDLLFRATMIDVASDNPSLDVNSARYKQLVEQRFEKVMLRTQSASYASITSGLQRTDSELLKMVSMFRSQQAMEFNKVVQAIGESRAAKGSSDSESAKKYLRQTIAGQLGSAAFYGTMTAFVNALLHKHDRYEDEDDKVSVGKVLSSIAIDSAETLAGITWLGDVAAQYLIEVTTGKNEFYGLPLGPLDTVIDLFDSFSTFRNSPSVANAKKVIGNAGNLKGVPINNIYNVLNAAVMWSADLFGKNPKDYDDVIRFLDYNATIERRITGQSAVDRMIALIGGDKPSETRQASYDAVRAQYDATGSSAFIPSDFDGSFTVDGNEYVLSRRQQREYVTARTDAYYSYLDDVVGSDIYENADEGTRTAILNSAKAYADDAAKAAYFESMNIPYKSSYKKLYEGVEIRGKDDDGNPKTDIPPVKPADIPEYLAWTATYKQAEKDKDYDAIDILLGNTGKLPASARTMFEHDVVDNLLAAVRGGASSESYYSYIAERNAGAKAMDITDGSSAAKLYGVSNAKMPDKDRNVLAELVLGENMYKVYDAAIESGVAPKHIPAIWDLIDADNSGKISQDELKEAHKSAGQYDDVFKNIWLAMVESGDWKKPWPYR